MTHEMAVRKHDDVLFVCAEDGLWRRGRVLGITRRHVVVSSGVGFGSPHSVDANDVRKIFVPPPNFSRGCSLDAYILFQWRVARVVDDYDDNMIEMAGMPNGLYVECANRKLWYRPMHELAPYGWFTRDVAQKQWQRDANGRLHKTMGDLLDNNNGEKW